MLPVVIPGQGVFLFAEPEGWVARPGELVTVYTDEAGNAHVEPAVGRIEIGYTRAGLPQANEPRRALGD